jgi:hypothetical protein
MRNLAKGLLWAADGSNAMHRAQALDAPHATDNDKCGGQAAAAVGAMERLVPVTAQ